LHLQDFTDSFANGKALCYLVHYYHPGLLRCEDILPTLNDEDAGLSEYQALANERANSALASKCVTELGGIPKMLPITDSRNPPDEKSMLLCLAYLCSRLMESSEEIFATILIQACYRRY
jgi:abnormal spindle-like microcephaly-associated protein